MYGIIANQYADDIKDVLEGKHILFERTGSFKPEEFHQICTAAAGVAIDVLIVDITCCSSDFDIVKGLRKYRVARSSRVVLIAPGRQPGDSTISALVGAGVYDIVSPALPVAEDEDEEPDELDIRPYLSQQLSMSYHLGNAARWHLFDEEPELPEREDTAQSKRGKKEKVVVVKETVREVEKVVQVETYKVLPNKTIVIGSLYPGAGSSFVAITIARLLNYLGVPNALVESPANTPELYSLLYGDKYAPVLNDNGREVPYPFLADQILTGIRVSREVEWTDGGTTWYPANPKPTFKQEWSYEHTYKLLLSVKSPIVLYDVSHAWQHDSVKNICLDADEVVFVCDPAPSKFDRPDTLKHTEFLADLKKKGKTVHVVANRDIETQLTNHRSEWIRSLPILPTCIHPYVPHQDIIESIWEGKLVQDHPEISQKLLAACYPLIRKLVPPSFPLQPLVRKPGLFSKIFKKGRN